MRTPFSTVGRLIHGGSSGLDMILEASHEEELIESFVEEEYQILLRLSKELNLPKPTKQAIYTEYPHTANFLTYLQLKQEGESLTYILTIELNLRALEIAYEKGTERIDSLGYRAAFQQVFEEVGMQRIRLITHGPETLSTSSKSREQGKILLEHWISYVQDGI